MNLIKLSEKYFNFFVNKNIDGLRLMFSDDIVLRDWEISRKGIEQVVSQNETILKNLSNFKLKILNISQAENIIYAEIEITLSNNEIITVLDKIEFDQEYKIKKITAFKG
tara:strand:- start:172 stop:501 length:330 start_codon:yes stop_codon:yes gene_type:complete